MKVSGGVGTIRLPPGPDGYRLGSVTTSLNVSAAVPALFSPEVWSRCKLREGSIISGEFRWQPMDASWAAHFPVLRDLRLGYLIVDDVRSRDREPGIAPIQHHPCTIMEYYSGAAVMYDYVYATVSSDEEDEGKADVERFFEEYRTANGRGGRYLLAADSVAPLWDADYRDPASLRRAERAGDASLRLIEARINDLLCGKETIEALLCALSESESHADLRRLSEDAGIPSGRWFGGGSIAEESARLVEQAVRFDKLNALVDVVMLPERRVSA